MTDMTPIAENENASHPGQDYLDSGQDYLHQGQDYLHQGEDSLHPGQDSHHPGPSILVKITVGRNVSKMGQNLNNVFGPSYLCRQSTLAHPVGQAEDIQGSNSKITINCISIFPPNQRLSASCAVLCALESQRNRISTIRK
jgi:hypothetical protein